MHVSFSHRGTRWGGQQPRQVGGRQAGAALLSAGRESALSQEREGGLGPAYKDLRLRCRLLPCVLFLPPLHLALMSNDAADTGGRSARRHGDTPPPHGRYGLPAAPPQRRPHPVPAPPPQPGTPLSQSPSRLAPSPLRRSWSWQRRRFSLPSLPSDRGHRR